MNFYQDDYHHHDNHDDKRYKKHHDKHDDKHHDFDNHLHKKKDSCVEETLRKIVKAQHEAEENHHHHHQKNRCRSGCNQAIEELLNPPKKPVNKNTIPVILYMKDGCPFKAEGVKTFHCDCCKDKKFKCFSTFVFRVTDINHDCVVLELLTFKHDPKHRNNCHDFCSPCDQIDGEKVKNLIRTGICINVDLDCFCAVSCLPALHLSPRHPKTDC